MIAKIVHEGEIHLYKGSVSLVNLKAHCANIFRGLRECASSLKFAYMDEEGDKINVSC